MLDCVSCDGIVGETIRTDKIIRYTNTFYICIYNRRSEPAMAVSGGGMAWVAVANPPPCCPNDLQEKEKDKRGKGERES